MKVEIDWHLARRVTPDVGYEVYFCVTDSDGRQFHAGQWDADAGVFLSDRANSVGERQRYAPAEVCCWAYPPEVPT